MSATIRCQDCVGSGRQSNFCTDPMCRDPETCGGPPTPCRTCNGIGTVEADKCVRYWAVPYYSKAKKRADKEKAKKAKEKRKQEERKWLAKEADRMEREAKKIRAKLARTKE